MIQKVLVLYLIVWPAQKFALQLIFNFSIQYPYVLDYVGMYFVCEAMLSLIIKQQKVQNISVTAG